MTGTRSSNATAAFSAAPGIISVTPTPKGRVVFARMERIEDRVCALERGPVARMPRPPASETAQTSSGWEIQLMPGDTMGWLMSSRSVRAVLMAGFSVPAGQGCESASTAGGLP